MSITQKTDVLKQMLNNSQDITTRLFCCKNNTKCGLVFIDSAVDKLLLSTSVIEPLQKFEWTNNKDNDITSIQQTIIAYTSVKTVKTIEDTLQDILNGFCAVLFDDCQTILMVECAKWITRLPSEPPTSAVIHGPREGFVEDITINMALIRKRLKTKELKVEQLIIGKETQTQIKVCYLSNIADNNVVNTIINKLKQIKIDGVIDSSYISAFLGDNKGSLFKQVGTAEKPDVVVAKMLEGRVAIVVDGSPFVLTLPFLYIEDLQSSNDYYLSPAHATFMRIMRCFGLFGAIILPGIYVALLVYHYEIIPIKLLITITNSIQGIPLPPFIEVLFIIIMFECLYEASLRMPRYIGLALSIVGAIILGDTAVKAGLISSPGVLVVAVAGMLSYTVPDQSAQISVLRVVFTIIGGIFGLYGLILSGMVLIAYLASMTSYNSPYLAPMSPFIIADQKDAILKRSLNQQKMRPQSIPNKNRRRQG